MGYEAEHEDYEEQINWDEVGNPPGKGKYNIIVSKAEASLSKSSHKHMVKCSLELEGCEDPSNESSIGRTVFINFNFTVQGGFIVKNFAKVSGVDLPKVVNKTVLEAWCQTIIGTQVGIVLDHRPYNDQMQADIKQFIPLIAATNTQGQAIDNTGGDEEEEVESESEDVEQPVEEEQTESLRASVKPNGKVVPTKATPKQQQARR